MSNRIPLVPWVDGPYKLIPIPGRVHNKNPHAAIHGAAEMAHAHNCLIRGLNSIVLQAPHVPDSNNPEHKPEDVKDLLKYVEVWVMTVLHHHRTEETCMFPLIEELAQEPGLMADPRDQHSLFHPGLELLLEYSLSTKPQEYRWEGESGMRKIIDAFTEHLMNHLHEEIDIFLDLERLDSKGFRRCWDEGEKMAKAEGNIELLYNMFPQVLGTCDKTYDGGNKFPPLAAPIPYAIHYWFSRRHSGAWRFNPCDYWGNPRPLQFVPESKIASSLDPSWG